MTAAKFGMHGCAQVIARMGRWNQAAAAMFQSYLMFFKPEGLLASGSWPGALEKDFGMFWAPRFCVEVPRSLIEYLFPWLVSLEQEVDDLGADAQPSHLAAPKVVAFAGSVLVQDALDLAPRFPDNLVHKHLLANDEFRCVCCLLVVRRGLQTALQQQSASNAILQKVKDT